MATWPSLADHPEAFGRYATLPTSSYAEFDTGHIVLAEQPAAFTMTVRDSLAAG
ncbi:hypothetical protein ACIRYZ_01560 [Kitasatospora sp. NPDC101155]|uniref:hypothetical protein n=1 Tax=Kitasatospora sp. NPDC101155 TaxID=3364097 RepID=UPI003821B1F4